jgi:hypothetical protein
MTGFNTLDNDDLGSNKIARSATANALYDNPIAIAQRDASAPWLNGIGAMTVYTTGSGTFNVPTGVYRMKVTCVGGGGAGLNGGSGSGGSDTTFGSLTARKGVAAAGGTASGGDINLNGEQGTSLRPAKSAFVGGIIGYGGRGSTGNGGAGATVVKIFTTNPAATFSYSVGTGETGSGENGGNGIIIIEY